MATKVLDIDHLDKIFNINSDNKSSEEEKIIDIIPTSVSIPVSSPEVITPKTDDNFIEEEMKELMKNANEIMKAAKYLISTAPDAETVASASTLISSITSIISEFNKSVLMNKRFKLAKELEDHKQNAKLQILELKNKQTQLSLGKGNTFNTQINNLVPFSQESVVKAILKEQEEKQKLLSS